MTRIEDFNRKVPLPPGLDVGAIRRAVDYMERALADLVDLYFEQANVFSAVIFLSRNGLWVTIGRNRLTLYFGFPIDF